MTVKLSTSSLILFTVVSFEFMTQHTGRLLPEEVGLCEDSLRLLPP
jgi:hypothetical protein